MWNRVKLADVRALKRGRPPLPKNRLSMAKVALEKQRISSAVNVLQKVPLFSELSNEQLEVLARSLTRTKITLNAESGRWSYSTKLPLDPRGGVVISQGDEGDTMFVVETGRLQAEVDIVRSVDNPEGVVKEYSEGEFFGELALVTSDSRGATVRCVDNCVLLSLDKSTVLALLPGQLGELVSAHRRRTAMNVLQKVSDFSDLSPSQLDQLVGKMRRIEIVAKGNETFAENSEESSLTEEFPDGVIIVSPVIVVVARCRVALKPFCCLCYAWSPEMSMRRGRVTQGVRCTWLNLGGCKWRSRSSSALTTRVAWSKSTALWSTSASWRWLRLGRFARRRSVAQTTVSYCSLNESKLQSALRTTRLTRPNGAKCDTISQTVRPQGSAALDIWWRRLG